MHRGILYILPTPIGNLSDFSERGKEVLKKADFILSEDTRRIRKLLSFFRIKGKKILSFYSGNEDKRIEFVIKNLKEGKNFVLTSESGTPTISDPGAKLISVLHKEGLKVTPIPGPSAVTTAYSASGFEDSDFIFMGFLPKKKKKMKETIERYISLGIPLIFFESSHRIKKTLQILQECFNNLDVFYIREMTKIYEEYFRGDLKGLIEYLKDKEIKGEITVIIKKK